jgi:hypothetical protein
MRRKITLLLAVMAAAVFASLAGTLYASDPEFDILAQKKGVAARELLDKPTLYRKAELKGMPCSSEDFDFLLDRPRTSVALAGKLHKSLDKYAITMTRPGTYHIDDKGNLVGDMDIVIREPGKRMYYIAGFWKLMPGVRLNGRMALIVEYKEAGTGKACHLDANARGYMMVDNSVAGAAFRLAAYLFPNKVDARINRFATAVSKVVQAIHDDPDAALKRVANSKNIPPDEVREFRVRFVGKPQ